MDMVTALAELGATEASIDAQTRERLDRDGYAPLPGVLSAAQLTAIRTRLAELLEAEGDQAGLEVHQENGADRLADLPNKGAMFDPCFTDPRLLACVAHVLGDFKLSSLNFRAALARPRPPAAARRLRRPGLARRVPGLQLGLAARRLHRGQRRDPGGARLPPVHQAGPRSAG